MPAIRRYRFKFAEDESKHVKQVLQNLGTGETALVDVPAPRPAAGMVLIATRRTLISAGTERMLVDFGKASLLDKARKQPDKVRMVLDKVRSDGLFTTVEAVRSKLDQPLALGYCNAGVVVDVGSAVRDFRVGDRVVSNGPHAEIVCVPKNLCARIPDGVSDEAAAFTVLASIGLQGVRLVAPTLGETVVVMGMGLIGLMTAQMLRANGCRVIGVDLDKTRVDIAQRYGVVPAVAGADGDPVAVAMALTGGVGVDAVIITASTSSSAPVSQAARMSRKRGRIVLVGVTGLELNRADFYEKELTFQVSCSYGPGRYDELYEAGGQDYPVGFVRWTEQRNFSAVLDLMSEGRLDTETLVSQRVPIESAVSAYEALTKDAAALGIILEYAGTAPIDAAAQRVSLVSHGTGTPTNGVDPVIGFIGAGNYSSRVLIPAFKATGAALHTVVTNSGASGVHHGAKGGFAVASTNVEDIIASESINTVVVVTRHNTHARFVLQSLSAGKNVFVEKPLALCIADLEAIKEAYESRQDPERSSSGARLMVGFNRRFSPLVARMKACIEKVSTPKAFIYTCNAGMIPGNHWTQDPEVGGGRILGEACHFIDLLRFLSGAAIDSASITTMGGRSSTTSNNDNATISLKFADGSIGTIHYFANGGKAFPKERIEVFAGDGVLQLDNFLELRGFGWKGFRKASLWRQNKGQNACAAAFVEAIRTGRPSPIPFGEIYEIARVSIELAQAQQTR